MKSKLFISLSCILLAALPVKAQENDFRSAMEYLIGEWKTKNTNHKPGDATPAYFGYDFTWGLNEQLATNEIFGLAEDGTKIVYWKTIAAWDYQLKRVLLYQFGASGTRGAGYEQVLNDTTRVVNLEFRAPNGEVSYYTDTTNIKGPNAYITNSYMKTTGDWQKRNSFWWERVLKSE